MVRALLVVAAVTQGVTGCAADSERAGSLDSSQAGSGAPLRPGSGDGVGASAPPLQIPELPVETGTGDSDGCNEIVIDFERQTPTVYLLVDRSSSMFDMQYWEPLKQGVLSVVQQLDQEVRFGFAAYTGQNGGVCPSLDRVDSLATGNYQAIRDSYEALQRPDFKGETPTGSAVDEVAGLLANDPEQGPRYILLVTDGEPDFCDDPNVTCSRDNVVAAVQRAHTEGIGTFIFSIGGQVAQEHLGDVANAGAGLPVEDRDMAVHYQCSGGEASYAETSGDARFFEPDVNDSQALVNEIGAVVAGVKSCVFDLQGQLEVDVDLASMGLVKIDGEALPYDDDNGWRMNSGTQIELLGEACAQLRQPDTQRIFFDFPCNVFII